MPTLEERRRQRRQATQAAAPTATPDEEFGTAPVVDTGWKEPERKFDTPEWEAARKDPELLNRIRRYAKNVENQDFSTNDKAFEWFVGDRRWKDSNTLSTLKELNFVKGTFGTKYASEQDLEDLSYIRDAWDKLPGGFSRIASGDITEGAGAIIENIAKGFVDPSIVFGGLAGKAVGTAFRKGASEAAKRGLKRTLQTTTSIATDATVTAGANVAYQETNVEVGLQEEVDGWEALKAGTLGAVLSTPGAISTFRPKPNELNVDFMQAAEQARRGATDLRKVTPGQQTLFGGATKTTDDGIKLSVDDIELAKQGQAMQGGAPIKENEPSLDANASIAAEKDFSAKQLVDDLNENIWLADALANTLPSMNKNDFFRWWGKNNPRVLDYITKGLSRIGDEAELNYFLKSFNETFPELSQNFRRGRVSDKQTEAEAQALLKGETELSAAEKIINTPTGYAANASELKATEIVMGKLYDDMDRFKKLSLDTNLSQAQLDTIENELNRTTSLLGVLGARLGGFKSEAGRSLRATGTGLSDTAVSKFIKTSTKVSNSILGLGKSKEDRLALLQDMQKALATLDRGDKLQLDLFVANLHQNRGNVSDVFYEMWYNWGLLSNPSTSVINFLGNTTTGVLESVERGVAAAFTKGERLPYLERIAGYATALPEALKVGFRTYKTELPTDPQTRLENMDKHAIPSWRVSKGGIKRAGVGETGLVVGGRQARIPGRLLLGADEFWKLLHQRAYIHESASRAAGDMRGSTRQAFLDNYYKNTPAEVLQGALEEARRLTYTDALGPGLRAFQQFVDEMPGGRIIIPFVRTPAKIIKQAADMLSIPGTFVTTDRTAAGFAAGGLARRRAMARITMGYSLLATGAIMALNGDATGSSPSDPGARVTFELNKLPWSVRVDNNWIQFNRWDPVAIPVTIGVGLEKTFESFNASGTGAEREDQFMSTMAAFMSDALLDKSFFQGVENVVGAIMEPERRFETFGKGVVRSFVPAISAGFARAADPRTTAPLTFWEVIQDRVGFDARKKVPTKLDRFGREVAIEVPGSYKGDEGPGHFVNRFILPFKAKSGANDPIANELYELGIKLNPTRKQFRDIDLDSAQAYIYNKAEGQQLYNGLKFAMSQPDWKDKSPAAKRLIVDVYKDYAAKTAQIMLVGVYPELLRRSVVENKELKKLTAPTRSDIRKTLEPKSER